MPDLTASRPYTDSNGSVGVSTATIIPAGTYSYWATVQNTHATQTLKLSFSTPVSSGSIILQPGASITMYPGPTNTLYGVGSGAGTTYATIGS